MLTVTRAASLSRALLLAGLGGVAISCTSTDGGDDPPLPPVTGVLYLSGVDPVSRLNRVIAVDADNGGVDTLQLPIGNAAAPFVSPDGRQLAFTDAGDVILYNFATGFLRDITYISGNDTGPVWHPNGTQVLVRRTLPSGDVFVLVNTDRSGERIVFTESLFGLVVPQPAWSPDGRWLYFAAFALPDPAKLRRLDLSELGATPVVLGPERVYGVAVSAATGAIAVIHGQPGTDSTTTALFDPTTGRLRALRTHGLAHRVAWSPDGAYLAVGYFRGQLPGLDVDIIEPRSARVVRSYSAVTLTGSGSFSWGPAPPPLGQ